jgi:hypothetical protein
MRITMIAVVGLMLALSAAPAFAFGGGGGHHAAQSGAVAVSSSGGSGAGATGGPVAATSEPFALFAVGLGLVGARFLRRR